MELDRGQEGEAAGLRDAGSAQRRGVLGRASRLGLSGRLFLLTIAFVALAEILIYVPTVANYRRAWLSDRIAAAQIAALALDAAPDRQLPDGLAGRLLSGVGARAIAVRGGGVRRLLAIETVPTTVAHMVDLRRHDWIESIGGAWQTLFAEADAPIRVVGKGQDGFELVEILLDEAPLRAAMMDFSIRLLVSSLLIAAAVAGLVFLVLQRAIVRPVRRLARNITAFAGDPEGPDRIIVPSKRADEIGQAETALARMQRRLATELREKRRLAGVGLSVSKINHELRNLLTTAQLLGDRLESVADPVVQRVAPRLVTTLDRAIRFCEATLAYGRATEPDARRRPVPLAPLIEEQIELIGLDVDARIRIETRIAPALAAHVDPEQFARALANILRNAVQALEGGAKDGAPRVTITGMREGQRGSGSVTIVVADNGPGLPERARAHLFAPFQGSMRPGGTGLGLAIAAELIQLNGGTLSLDPGTAGASFRIVIPDEAQERAEAA
ncbi:sensor histidine kinase [Methylobacterium iners]|uniref:histidine kinase n=1 Tax=Methylobacterium iners TaxID=418707 RepID=A0ABQ4S0J5_9HYPH|nr:HAMP domain-containing sensor histidine kinase [Methylobacterium iners]GJD95989.1 Adaptive-response sensory-kinase SasA [Methylobacterium iners]